jgi:hypothetical protein
MAIAQLMIEAGEIYIEAGEIFGLDPNAIVLLLFSLAPVTLRRDALISGPPQVLPGSKVMIFLVPSSADPVQYHHHVGQGQGYHHMPHEIPHQQPVGQDHGYYHVPHEAPLPQAFSSKLQSTFFKLPKFDGIAKSWKGWEKSFQRFLGFHQLDHVLEEDFPSLLWTTPGAKAANKMVFFLIEDAVATGTLATKLVRQATKWDGHGAFMFLRNGYVFNGPQTATILLTELSKIRLRRDEDASGFCLRLVELIEDLELVSGDAAVYLTDTQKLGYLLSAIRHESSLESVYSQLLSEQLRGTACFDQACRELHHRVEAMKADDLVDNRSGRALISTEGKKKGQQAIVYDKVLCLAKDCKELIQPYLPLCKLCFLQSMAGKIEILVLRDNLGNAVFNPTTKKLDFLSTVPKTRFPKKNMKKGKALMGFVTIATDSPSPVFVPFCAFHDFHATDAGEYPDPPVVELPGYPLTGQVPGSFATSDITTGPDSPLLEATVPALATASPLQDSGAIGTSGCYGPQRNLSEAIYVDSSYGDLAHGRSSCDLFSRSDQSGSPKRKRFFIIRSEWDPSSFHLVRKRFISQSRSSYFLCRFRGRPVSLFQRFFFYRHDTLYGGDHGNCRRASDLWVWNSSVFGSRRVGTRFCSPSP